MEFKVDSIVQKVINRFKTRAEFGQKKYGTNLDRKDLHVGEWIQHLQDELHDAYLYSEKLKEEHENHTRLLHLAVSEISKRELWEGSLSDLTEYNNLLNWYHTTYVKSKRSKS